MPQPLATDDLHFGYEPERLILAGLTAQLEAGRLTVLLGPNGAGKTTLVRLMLGQLTPTRGSVKLDGREVSGWRPQRRAAVMSYVPQRASVNFAFTVGEVVAMGRYAQVSRPAAIEEAMELCGLMDLRSRAFHQLSFGQQQRVLLARAVAQSAGDGRVMLLDEPGSAMDLWHVHRMMQTLVSLAQRGLAVMVVLHDLNLAARYADLVWLLHDGRLAASGEWNQVLRPEILEPIYRVRLTDVGSAAPEVGGNSGGRPVFIAEPVGTLSEVG